MADERADRFVVSDANAFVIKKRDRQDDRKPTPDEKTKPGDRR